MHPLRGGSLISSHYPKHILSLSQVSPSAPRWIKFFTKNWNGRYITLARNHEQDYFLHKLQSSKEELGPLEKVTECRWAWTFSLSIQGHPGKPIAVFHMGILAREILRISFPLIPLEVSSRVPAFSCTRFLPKWHFDLCTKDCFPPLSNSHNLILDHFLILFLVCI